MSTSTDADVLGGLLTRVRLQSYLEATRGDLGAALRLYDWNTMVSAAAMATVAMVEVVVRNAMDAQLTRWADLRDEESWLEIVPLERRGIDDLERAQRAVENRGASTRFHDRVVAELGFGLIVPRGVVDFGSGVHHVF